MLYSKPEQRPRSSHKYYLSFLPLLLPQSAICHFLDHTQRRQQFQRRRPYSFSFSLLQPSTRSVQHTTQHNTPDDHHFRDQVNDISMNIINYSNGILNHDSHGFLLFASSSTILWTLRRKHVHHDTGLSTNAVPSSSLHLQTYVWLIVRQRHNTDLDNSSPTSTAGIEPSTTSE